MVAELGLNHPLLELIVDDVLVELGVSRIIYSCSHLYWNIWLQNRNDCWLILIIFDVFYQHINISICLIHVVIRFCYGCKHNTNKRHGYTKFSLWMKYKIAAWIPYTFEMNEEPSQIETSQLIHGNKNLDLKWLSCKLTLRKCTPCRVVHKPVGAGWQ